MRYAGDLEDREALKELILEDLRNYGLKSAVKQKKNGKHDKNNSSSHKTQVFHRPLEELPTQRVKLKSGVIVDIPVFLVQACNHLCKQIRVEGLFRKAGSVRRQKDIRTQICSGKSLGSDHNVIDVACLIKQFFRELPQPLIPYTHHQLLTACLELKDKEKRTWSVLSLCLLFPAAHLGTLAYFIQFLADVSRNSKENLMDASNLAIIMAPTLMPSEDNKSESAGSSVDGAKLLLHSQVIECFIHNSERIGVVPDALCERLGDVVAVDMDRVDSCEEVGDENCRGIKKKKKRRSGSLTRVINGLRRMVSGRGSCEELDRESLESAATPDFSPCIKSLKKRKAGDQALAFSSKKKRDVLHLLPHGVLSNTPYTPNGMHRSKGEEGVNFCITPKISDKPSPTNDLADKKLSLKKRGRRFFTPKSKRRSVDPLKVATEVTNHPPIERRSSVGGRMFIKHQDDKNGMRLAVNKEHIPSDCNSPKGTVCGSIRISDSRVSRMVRRWSSTAGSLAKETRLSSSSSQLDVDSASELSADVFVDSNEDDLIFENKNVMLNVKACMQEAELNLSDAANLTLEATPVSLSDAENLSLDVGPPSFSDTGDLSVTTAGSSSSECDTFHKSEGFLHKAASSDPNLLQEYEEIKSRVTVLESQLAAELGRMDTEQTGAKPSPCPTNAVQNAYEKTLQQSEKIIASKPDSDDSCDVLSRRLDRELKIRGRNSTENQVFRSPSARKIGTLRRRSKERSPRECIGNVQRSQSWSVALKKDSKSLCSSNFSRGRSFMRSTLRRGRPNTVQSGLPQPSPMELPAAVLGYGSRIHLAFHQPSSVQNSVPTSESTETFSSNRPSTAESADSGVGSSRDTSCAEALQIHYLSMEHSLSNGDELVCTPRAEPLSSSNQNVDEEHWQAGETAISENIPESVTGRASIVKIRSEKAGIVLANVKLFDVRTSAERKKSAEDNFHSAPKINKPVCKPSVFSRNCDVLMSLRRRYPGNPYTADDVNCVSTPKKLEKLPTKRKDVKVSPLTQHLRKSMEYLTGDRRQSKKIGSPRIQPVAKHNKSDPNRTEKVTEAKTTPACKSRSRHSSLPNSSCPSTASRSKPSQNCINDEKENTPYNSRTPVSRNRSHIKSKPGTVSPRPMEISSALRHTICKIRSPASEKLKHQQNRFVSPLKDSNKVNIQTTGRRTTERLPLSLHVDTPAVTPAYRTPHIKPSLTARALHTLQTPNKTPRTLHYSTSSASRSNQLTPMKALKRHHTITSPRETPKRSSPRLAMKANCK